MKRKLLSILLSSLLIFVSIGMAISFPAKVLATGNTYFVATTGSDSNNGSLATPFLTINKAAQVATAGDTVNIVAGTYNTTRFTISTSGTAGNPITFQNYSGGTVIVDGTGAGITEYGICTILASYITISGITFRNSPYYGIMVDADSATRSNIIIQNCTTYNCGCSGICTTTYYDNGVQIGNLTYVTITGNTVHDTNTSSNFEGISLVGVNHFTVSGNILYNINYAAGACINAKVGCTNGNINNNTMYNSSAPGVYLDARGTETSINIFDNLIYNLTNAAIALADENGTNTLGTPSSPINVYNNICYGNARAFEVTQYGTEVITFNLINNTFYNNNNTTPGQEILIASYAANLSSCVIRNNIIYSLTSGVYSIWFNNDPGGTNCTVDHNLFYNSGGSWNAGSTQGTSQVTSNPLFIGPTANFALQSTSPAIDAGSSTSAPSTDYIGTSRPQGLGYDIGAYEFFTATTLYTTLSGQTATSLAIVFAVIVLIVLLIGIGLYVKTAATSEGISPQILIVGALVAAVIGVLGIALIVSLMMRINFI